LGPAPKELAQKEFPPDPQKAPPNLKPLIKNFPPKLPRKKKGPPGPKVPIPLPRNPPKMGIKPIDPPSPLPMENPRPIWRNGTAE